MCDYFLDFCILWLSCMSDSFWNFRSLRYYYEKGIMQKVAGKKNSEHWEGGGNESTYETCVSIEWVSFTCCDTVALLRACFWWNIKLFTGK